MCAFRSCELERETQGSWLAGPFSLPNFPLALPLVFPNTSELPPGAHVTGYNKVCPGGLDAECLHSLSCSPTPTKTLGTEIRLS